MKGAWMLRAWMLVALTLLSSGLAGRASAEELSLKASAPVERRHLLRADAGFSLGLGLGGITYGYSPRSWFRLEGGVSYGLLATNDAPTHGAMISAMPKFSLGSGEHRFLAGAGMSVGFSEGDRYLFINVDAAGYEYRAKGGFTFSVSAGFTSLIGGEGWLLMTPQARIGIGYRF